MEKIYCKKVINVLDPPKAAIIFPRPEESESAGEWVKVCTFKGDYEIDFSDVFYDLVNSCVYTKTAVSHDIIGEDIELVVAR